MYLLVEVKLTFDQGLFFRYNVFYNLVVENFMSLLNDSQTIVSANLLY